jgi:hypothetical protein
MELFIAAKIMGESLQVMYSYISGMKEAARKKPFFLYNCYTFIVIRHVSKYGYIRMKFYICTFAITCIL